jgi:hypothetical protein
MKNLIRVEVTYDFVMVVDDTIDAIKMDDEARKYMVDALSDGDRYAPFVECTGFSSANTMMNDVDFDSLPYGDGETTIGGHVTNSGLVIYSDSEYAYWSEKDGWTSKCLATRYHAGDEIQLPMSSEMDAEVVPWYE